MIRWRLRTWEGSTAARVLIVDDSESMRLLVRLSLEMDASFEVVGEAANGLDGLRKSEELDPDLIVMDLSMPVMDGIEATRRIKQGRPEVGIVAFSAAGEEAIVQKVLAAGAYARVDKEDLIGLLHALQEMSKELVPIGAPSPTSPDLWLRARDGVAAGLASLAAFARNLGNERTAGALGIAGAALVAVLMFLITVAPGGHDPSRVVRPESVIEAETVAPEVGTIELNGDVEVHTAKREHDERAGDAPSEPIEVEVASLGRAPSSPSTDRSSSPNGDGQSHAGGHGGHGGGPSHAGHNPGANGPPGNGPPGNGPPGNGPPGNGPQGNGPQGNGPQGNGHGHGPPAHHGGPGQGPPHDHHGPPVTAKKNGKVAPGLAKKPGHLPPGQAKKGDPGKGGGPH